MNPDPTTKPQWPTGFFGRLSKAPTQILDELDLDDREKEQLLSLQREHKRFTDMRAGTEKAELLDELRKMKRAFDAIKTTDAGKAQSLEWQTLLY